MAHRSGPPATDILRSCAHATPHTHPSARWRARPPRPGREKARARKPRKTLCTAARRTPAAPSRWPAAPAIQLTTPGAAEA